MCMVAMAIKIMCTTQHSFLVGIHIMIPNLFLFKKYMRKLLFLHLSDISSL